MRCVHFPNLSLYISFLFLSNGYCALNSSLGFVRSSRQPASLPHSKTPRLASPSNSNQSHSIHQLGGTSTAPNPVEIVLSGLGQCLAVGYAAAASVHSIKINSLKIELTGDINLMPFLGLGQAQGSDNAGYRGIKVDVHLDAEGDKKVLEAIHQHVMATSPVGHTISRPVPVDFKLHTN